MFPYVLNCTRNQYGCFGPQQLHFIDCLLPKYLSVCHSYIRDDCLETQGMYTCGLTAAAISEKKYRKLDFLPHLMTKQWHMCNIYA